MSKKWSYTNQDININIMFWENREYFRFYIPFGTLYINYSSVLIKNALHVCWVCIIYGCHEKNTLKQSLLGKAEWNYFRGQVPSGSLKFWKYSYRYVDDKELLNLVILFNFIFKKKGRGWWAISFMHRSDFGVLFINNFKGLLRKRTV